MSAVHVYAEHIDFLEQTRSVLSDCSGTFDGKTLRCGETEPFCGQDEVSLEAGRVILCHDGDTHSRIELRKDAPGTAQIQTPYGEIRCVTRLLEYRRSPNEAYIEYEILQETDVVSHIGLTYRFTNLD